MTGFDLLTNYVEDPETRAKLKKVGMKNLLAATTLVEKMASNQGWNEEHLQTPQERWGYASTQGGRHVVESFVVHSPNIGASRVRL